MLLGSVHNFVLGEEKKSPVGDSGGEPTNMHYLVTINSLLFQLNFVYFLDIHQLQGQHLPAGLGDEVLVRFRGARANF